MARSLPWPPYERFAQHEVYGAVAWLGRDAIAYTSNLTGEFNLWRQAIGPRGERGFARPLTAFRDRAVRAFVPSPDGRTIYFTADEDGDEQFQIYRLSTDGGDPEPLTSDRTVRHELGRGALHVNSGRLLYVDNARTPGDMDVVVHDLRRGTVARPLEKGHLWTSPRWDPGGRRFLALEVRLPIDVHSFVHDLDHGTTTEILPHEAEDGVVAQDWTPDGRGLLVLSNVEGEFLRLERVDLAKGSRKVLLAGPHDVEASRVALGSGAILAVVNEDGYSSLQLKRGGDRFRRIQSLPSGCTLEGLVGQNVDLDADGRRALVTWHTGTRPAEIVVVPVPTGRTHILTESMVGGVPGGPLAPPRLVRFRSFDGREISAFYYVPAPRPRRPAPAVLCIHGGPAGQDRPAWLYSGLYAYLVAWGIRVLAPNFRGSTGYGKTFELSIYHDWGGNELRDLRTAAEWLRAQRGVDARRLGVFGMSFGGFATLSCLSRLPEYWKVGVDVCGPANLVTFVKSVPPFWARWMDRWVGDPLTEAKFLRDRSPISYIDQVQADVLIVQGAKDPRVNVAESDQMVDELRSRGRRVEYLVFPDEGHGFTKTANLLRAYGTVARFLTDHLVGATGRRNA